MFFDGVINLSEFDVFLVMIISFLTSVLVIVVYEMINNSKKVHIAINNTGESFYGNGKSGYLEVLKKMTDKTRYVECHFILSVYNESNRPFVMHNIYVVDDKRKKKLEEGVININGTVKSIAGVTSYDKLNKIIVSAYHGEDYDVNIRLSKEEYSNLKMVYIYYCDNKNKKKYIKLSLNKNS